MEKRYLRLALFSILTFLSYCLFLYSIYFSFNILLGIISAFLIICFIYYVIIQLNKNQIYILFLISILLSLLVLCYIGFNIPNILSLGLINYGIINIGFKSHEEISTRKVFLIKKIFSAGAGQFILLSCIATGIFAANKFPSIDINCINLYNYLSKAIDLLPIERYSQDLNKSDIKKSLKKYFTMSPKSAISSGIDLGLKKSGLEEQIAKLQGLKSSIEGVKGKLEDSSKLVQNLKNNSSKSDSLFDSSNMSAEQKKLIESQLSKMLNNKPDGGTNQGKGSIDNTLDQLSDLGNLGSGLNTSLLSDSNLKYLDKDYLKASIINQIGIDPKFMDKKMCTIGVDIIETGYDNQFLRYYLYMIMALSIGIVLKLFSGILVMINIFLFKTFKLFNLYSVDRVMEEVEILE